MSKLVAGDPAHAITLQDDSGTSHRLTDQQGRWTVVTALSVDDGDGERSDGVTSAANDSSGVEAITSRRQ